MWLNNKCEPYIIESTQLFTTHTVCIKSEEAVFCCESTRRTLSCSRAVGAIRGSGVPASPSLSDVGIMALLNSL
jgi:hypothetical protein